MRLYTSDELKALNTNKKQRLDSKVWKICKQLGLVQGTKRGIRSGKQFKRTQISPSPLSFTSTKIKRNSPSNQLIIGYTNARSVKNKSIVLCDFIFENKFDIFFISETWLSDIGDEFKIKELTPPGYSFIHCAREGGSFGGVGLVFRSELTIVEVKKSVNFQSFEYVLVRLSLSKETVFLSCVYRPPRSEKNNQKSNIFHDEFSEFLDLFLEKENFIICGDINFHYNKKDDCNTKKLITTFESKNLRQLISVPTHNLGNTLDWLVSHNNCDSYIKSIDVQDFLISDHFVITIKTDFSKPKSVPKSICCRNLRGINLSTFKSNLLDSDLLKNPPSEVNELANLYNDTISNLIDNHAPLKKKSITDRGNKEWFDSEVKEAKKKKRTSEAVWRNSNHENVNVNRENYKKVKNEYNQILERVRSKNIQKDIDSASKNSKKTFDIINKLLGKKDNLPVLPDLDEKSAADTLSTYFIDKIKLISSDLEAAASDLPEAEDSVTCSGSVISSFSSVNEDTVRKIINKSKKTSCHLDPAPTKFILQFLDILLPIIVLIINRSLELGCVPDCFKEAIVKPLLKKATLDPSNCKNYRPVSNLPYVSKLLERVIAEQLLDHLNENSYLDKFQSAYRPGFSCETALLKVVNDSLIDINTGNLVLLVLLDLSAAFDTINHEFLLNRLKSVAGIQDLALRWFDSYLSNRCQTVLVGSSFSDKSLLNCGVPQGSVLGPILFSIYTSSLGRVIEGFGIGRQFFADDTQLIKSFKPDPDIVLQVVQNLEACCSEIKQWMLRNRLKLNDEKTEVILFGPQERRNSIELKSIKVGESDIEIVDSVRNLGLFLDAELSMSVHVNKIVKNCYFHLRRLGQIRHLLTREAANALAVATITSRHDYCNSTLWGINSYQLDRLQKLQNTAARIVCRTKTRDHITPLLNDLHWLPVKRRIDHKILSLTYACLHGLAPDYLIETIPQERPTRSLRSASHLRVCLPSVDSTNKVKFGGRSFCNAAPKLWNNLPVNLKKAKNIQCFRKGLKSYLFQQD